MLKTDRVAQAPGVTAQLKPAIRLLFAGDVVEELFGDFLIRMQQNSAEQITLRQIGKFRQAKIRIETLKLRIVEGCHLLCQN